MEWTKEELIGTCILYTGKGSIQNISKFYESYGFEGLTGTARPYTFIGIPRFEKGRINIPISIWSDSMQFDKVIKLPSKPRRKFPREMMVSNDNITWKKQTIYAKVENEFKFVARPIHMNSNAFAMANVWRYAKEIEEPEKTSLDSLESLKDFKERVRNEAKEAAIDFLKKKDGQPLIQR